MNESTYRRWIAGGVVVAGMGAASATEIRWDFESGDPLSVFESVGWGARDSTFSHGPRGPANGGEIWAGTPRADRSLYPPARETTLESDAIDLARGHFPSLFVSWVQWVDSEGRRDPFDGAQFQISVNGGAYRTVDDPPGGALFPPYDAAVVKPGPLPLSRVWTWCWDTVPEGVRDDADASAGWVPVVTGDLVALGYCRPEDVIRLRWRFLADPAFGGAGYFIDDLRVADSPPPCRVAPVIGDLSIAGAADTSEGAVLTASIQPSCAPLDSSALELTYVPGAEEDTLHLPLVASGVPGEFTATIPPQPWGTRVNYWVSAADTLGNRTTSAIHTYDVEDLVWWGHDDGRPFFLASAPVTGDDALAVAFRVPRADSTVTIRRVSARFARSGTIDVGIWDDDAEYGSPGTRRFSSGPIPVTAGSGWWEYELPGGGVPFDSGRFYVGFSYISVDSTDDPGPFLDAEPDARGTQWRRTEGQWRDESALGGSEALLRVQLHRQGPEIDPLSVRLTPHRAGTRAGSEVRVDYRVDNDGTEDDYFDLWMELLLRGVEPHPGGPLVGPYLVYLPAGIRTVGSVNVTVPDDVEPGFHSLCLYAGTAPDIRRAESCAALEVVPVPIDSVRADSAAADLR